MNRNHVILTILMAGVMMFSSCGTIEITAYPEHWPEANKSIDISGNYGNAPSPFSYSEDQPTLFTFFYYISGFYRYDEEADELNDAVVKEFAGMENNVEIVQNKDEIIISLFNKEILIKKIVIPYLSRDNDGLVLTYHSIMAGEVFFGNEFEFYKAQNGSLIVNNKMSTQYGWFLESTDRNNQWYYWDKVY